MKSIKGYVVVVLAALLGGVIGSAFNRPALAQGTGFAPVQFYVNGHLLVPVDNKISINISGNELVVFVRDGEVNISPSAAK